MTVGVKSWQNLPMSSKTIDHPTAAAKEWRPIFEALLRHVAEAGQEAYGPRLRALVVFGSVGRGTPRPDSDIDLLIVAEDLPEGRIARVSEFAAVERRLAPALAEAAANGVHTVLSPVFRTPTELQRGSLLMLDLVDDARVLVDRDDTFANAVNRLQARLRDLGARRVWVGNAWYWDLKPDYRIGEVFEL